MRRQLLVIVVVALGWVLGIEPAWAQDAGSGGGPCYGNGTCNAGLACQSGTCVAPAVGTLGGPCYGNSTCNGGMTCEAATQTCVAAPQQPAPQQPPPGGPPAAAPLAPAPATAAAPAPVEAAAPMVAKRWWIAGKVGFLLPGTVTIEETDLDSDSGLLILASADFSVAPKLTIGGFALFAQSGLEGEVDASVTTFGGTIKGRFAAGRVEFRPGASVGYQMIGGDAFEGTDDSQGLEVGGLVELALPLTPQADFVGEIGFITQPTGGNEDLEITFGPIFYISAGVAFGG